MRIGDAYFSELVVAYEQAYRVLHRNKARMDINLLMVPRATDPLKLINIDMHVLVWKDDKLAWSYTSALYRPPRRQLYPAGRALAHALYRLSADMS